MEGNLDIYDISLKRSWNRTQTLILKPVAQILTNFQKDEYPKFFDIENIIYVINDSGINAYSASNKNLWNDVTIPKLI